VLAKYKDVLTNGLPKEQPLRREVDQEIEVLPPAEPPSKAPSRLKKQVSHLLKKGFVRLSKSPYGALLLLMNKKDGKL
jgi:hypothetical protein